MVDRFSHWFEHLPGLYKVLATAAVSVGASLLGIGVYLGTLAGDVRSKAPVEVVASMKSDVETIKTNTDKMAGQLGNLTGQVGQLTGVVTEIHTQIELRDKFAAEERRRLEALGQDREARLREIEREIASRPPKKKGPRDD